MSVQKNSAEQEIKAADNDADGATSDMDIVILAIRVQAIGKALLLVANKILCFHQEEN
jgi:predicted dinucleotide-binding enzyme